MNNDNHGEGSRLPAPASDDRRARSETPASAWTGAFSQTTGRTAMPAFESISPPDDPTRKHDNYSDKAKARLPDPTVFKGSM